MILPRTRRTALLALGAAVLLGTLVFLFVRSAGFDARRDSDTAALLRELRAIDLRIDAEAARLSRDHATAQAPVTERAALTARVLRELEQRANPATAARVPVLAAAVTEKLSRLATFRSEHDKAVAGLRSAEEAAAALVAESRTARLRNPGIASATYAVESLAEALRHRLREVTVEGSADDARAIESLLATLQAAAPLADPVLGARARVLEASARAYLGAVATEATAYRQFAFHPAGAQVDLAAREVARTLDQQLEEQPRWRVYLFFYAAALLLAVGYLAARVAVAQAQLRAANDGLERRVTERTRDLSTALDRLKESEAQLVQSEKMSSLGQMVAGVAHEINTPLAYVKNSLWTVRERMPDLRDALAQAERLAGLLRSEAPDPAELESAFAALGARLARIEADHVIEDLEGLTRDGVHGIEQIAELVANLKNFSRVDRSRIASFNVNEGVQAALMIARSQLRNVTLEKRLGEIPSITCSPSQVNQVVLNLLTNAAQSLDKVDGRVIVATRRVDAGAICIEVEDNGRGIAPEVLPRIFDPFFTTKEVGKGTGLGLSIAYKIVQQHGGVIDVRTEVGKGTTFSVTLPVEPPDSLARESVGEPQAAA